VPTNGSGFAATSKLAPIHADPLPAAAHLGGKLPAASRAVTSTGSPSRGSNVTGFLETPALTRQEAAKTPAFQPIGKLPKPSQAENSRPALTTHQAPDRVPSRRPQQTAENPDAAQLVDVVFAADAWLEGP
jgi:hypothetical protein